MTVTDVFQIINYSNDIHNKHSQTQLSGYTHMVAQ